jgi:redox-sensitive bicupin YhaK (pirin superfamily)
MAVRVRKASEHGKTRLDWLDSTHGFSFGGYRDSTNINFGKLIVFNDDIVKAGKGFGSHSHDNAEIFSFVLDGALEHKDSTGNHGILGKYEIQRISAGSGITHSEFNHSKEREVHFLQIWLEPRTPDASPTYEQRSFADLMDKKGMFKLVSGKPAKDTVYIDQDAEFLVGHLGKESVKVEVGTKRGLYLYLLDGKLKVGGVLIKMGDSVEVTDVKHIGIESQAESRFVMLNVPML